MTSRAQPWCQEGHPRVAANITGGSDISCKACKTAMAWALRHGLPRDHPDVRARANASFKAYTEGDEL
jgi:hypothetical protein